MQTKLVVSTLLFSSIACASLSPINTNRPPLYLTTTNRSAPCPQVFSLNISTPGHTFSGLPIVQSGRSTYLSTTPITAPDSLARFYRNDSTHLFATGFDTQYMEQKQTPPYQMVTFDFGFNIFTMDPVVARKTYPYLDGSYTIKNATQELDFVSDDGGPGGWWVCGEEDSTVWEVLLGTVNFGDGSGCFPVSVTMHPLAHISQDVC